MTKKQMEKLLPGVHNLIRERAHKYHRKTGVPFDELLSQAYIGFMQATGQIGSSSWDTGRKVKFSTWCYRKVTTSLMTYLHKRFSDRHCFFEDIKDEVTPIWQSHAPAAFRNFVEEQARELSPEAQKMIHFLINTPQADGEIDHQELLQEACDHLAFEHGYDDVTLQIAKTEIKMALAL